MVVALVVTLGIAVSGQGGPAVKLPMSPQGQAAVQLGGRWEKDARGQLYRDGTWVVVDYGRPLLRGRPDIFGSGADYGKRITEGGPVWRAGANDTTRLTTQTPLQIGGTTIQPGIYSVFVELKPAAWTFVLSTQPVQAQYDPKDTVNLYGSYNYDPKFVVLRAPMTVKTVADSVEQFTIAFVNVTESRATLTMAWEKTVASVDLSMAGASSRGGVE
jgi:hypothetical protein